ncbi:MAG: ACP S-malonyltransferase [Thermodesulfobacteria bacterium]|nr:ACP S-malonyltransferase [Thermodesulfobacteriota bacterium]
MGKVAFLFPGQGSQYVGMGADYLDSFDFVQEFFDRAEATTGIPVKRLCLEGPMEELTRTVNLQPCLTTIDIIIAKALMEQGVKPDAVAGHSLGEYPALWAAGALDFEDCLRLVKERGTLMDEAASQRPGAMAAIIGVEKEELQGLIEEVKKDSDGVLAMANHNSREQIVVTGEKHLIKELCGRIKALGKRAVPLKVSGAYHSPLMRDAAEAFGEMISKAKFNTPAVPIYTNVEATPQTQPDRISSLMKEQMCAPVRWFEIVNNMYDDGVRTFIEVGPKKVLTNLVRKSLEREDYQTFHTDKVQDLQVVCKELAKS